ncbi:Universal stress protein family protein [Roseovarius litorisediminis]|uniref:Universal stress protein family protein n=1 Tax=Roseovarius litorisediminis TaxID=1312363 RepID=A0A1Y5RKI9_9RHOB|nr:universal stress protein [Roseovarius litorisediminis]SLN19760.1 Universal stress protein family protein [Roseovarius litorisediminis]
MSGKFVVAYDGSEAAERALDFAVAKAKSQGGSILVAHILEWSPYSFLTPTELEERHKRRGEELARAEKALMGPVTARLADSGVKVETVIKYGHIANTLIEICNESGADQMFIGRDGETSLGSRIFGSVAMTLAQSTPVPCTIVP